MSLNITELESRIKSLGGQLEQSLANHNFISGLKTEAERVLALLKSNVEVAVEQTVQETVDPTTTTTVEETSNG